MTANNKTATKVKAKKDKNPFAPIKRGGTASNEPKNVKVTDAKKKNEADKKKKKK